MRLSSAFAEKERLAISAIEKDQKASLSFIDASSKLEGAAIAMSEASGALADVVDKVDKILNYFF